MKSDLLAAIFMGLLAVLIGSFLALALAAGSVSEAGLALTAALVLLDLAGWGRG